MHRPSRILIRLLLAMCLLPLACAKPQPWTPPERTDTLPPPEIYHFTPDGLVPITPAQAAEIARQERQKSAQKLQHDGSNRSGEAHSNAAGRRPASDSASLMSPSWAESRSRPRIAVESAGPTRDQPYYIRGEHTAHGYLPGHYRREGDFIRGEHTPTGYIRGSYLGSGDYVRGEHTATGYIPGHYRSVRQPTGPYLVPTISPSSQSLTFTARPLR